MDHFVDLFEVYTPVRGASGDYTMRDIHALLTTSHGLEMEEQAFYSSNFKALMQQKITAYRAQNGMPAGKSGGPRYARPHNGTERFFGIRLASYESP